MKRSLKNKGLLKIKGCVTSVINIKKEKTTEFIQILDEFLTYHNNKFKSNKLALKILDLLEYATILNEKKTFTKKKVKINDDDDNYLKFKKKITEGTYGEINSCLLNKVNVIVKNPKYKDYSEDEVNINFLKENLVHIILFCCHDLMNKCFKISSVPTCIPEILNLVKATDKNKKDEKPIVIMEKLDNDGFYFFDKKHFYKDELTFIALVAYNIYFLQSSLKKFMHRDLHCGNIMTKKLNKSKNVDIMLNGKKFLSVSSKYETYIIDYGMTCVDLAACLKIMQMPRAKISVEGNYYSNYCDNKSHDMRLFLASIYFSCDKISYKLQTFLSSLLDKYKAESWHDFYEQVLKVKDKNFYPENILNKIKDEMTGML
jgi:hypothetical protein